MKHAHRAKEIETRSWAHCVAGHAGPAREHGNVVKIAQCACGAVRASESNAGSTAYGPWRTK